VLDHPHGDLRDVEYLPPDDSGRRAVGGQRASAAGAGARLVQDDLVGDGDLPQRAALPPRLPAGRAPGPAAQRRGRRLAQPVGRRRPGGVPRGDGQLPLELRNPGVLLGDAGLQLGDRPFLGRYQRRQLLIGRRGHGPIVHIRP